MVMKAEEVIAEQANVENFSDIELLEAELSQTHVKVHDLPSRYLPYPPNSTIWIKPYNFSELEKIQSCNSNETKILPTLIALNKNNGIKLIGINSIEDLDFIDFMYINMLRKVISFDENSFNLEGFSCPYCKKDIEKVTLDCRAINFAEIEEEVKALPIGYTLSNGEEIECSTLTVGSALQLNLSAQVESDLTRLSYKITNMNQKEAYDLLSEVSDGEDLINLQLLNALTDFENNYVEIDCPDCKKKLNVRVPEVLNLAIPFRRKERPVGNQFRFGKN